MTKIYLFISDMKSRIILLLSTVLTLTTISIAGNPIRGFVVDIESSEPLPVANILIEGTMRGGTTNLDGYFVIDGLEPGVYNLLISYLGYNLKEEEVIITQELMPPLMIEMIPNVVQLEEVVVSVDEKDEIETRVSPLVSNIPMNMTTIRQMPSLGAEMDVLRAIQALPGVKASSEISSGIYVRGGSPSQSLILMDHNVVYNPSHMFGLFSTFNADAVKRIELMKGGFPAQYGGRSGSVLEIITNEGNRKKTEGMVSLGAVSARGSLEGPLPKQKGSYAVSARRTYLEPVMALIFDEDEDIPEYYFYDGNGKVNLDLTDKSTLTLAGYWGNDNLDLTFGPEGNSSSGYLNWGNRTFSSRFRQVLSRNAFLSANAAVSRYRSKSGLANEEVKLSESYDRLLDYSFKTDLEILGKNNHKLKMGIGANQYDFKLFIENIGVKEIDINTISNLYSSYIEDSWLINPLFEVKPGLRFYYYNPGEYFRIDPRLALVYFHQRNMRFKIVGGRYSQFINTLTFGEGASNFDMWVPVDETIDPSYSDQIVFGFEWEPRADLEFTAETYYTDMKNLVELNNVITEEIETTNDAFFDGGDGYAYGFEWMLRRKEGRLTGWLGYSLSWTKRRFSDTYLNNGNWFYPIWDRRHDIIATMNYALNHRWEIS